MQAMSRYIPGNLIVIHFMRSTRFMYIFVLATLAYLQIRATSDTTGTTTMHGIIHMIK